jgi:ABC-type proline/glycine betaine transport system ATPase subunit
MRFLTEYWLRDVSTDYAAKCILISAALTILERALLPERPAFFVTTGQRGGGKTTTLQMIFLAATG